MQRLALWQESNGYESTAALQPSELIKSPVWQL
jgi:hypothetical protein